MGLLRCSAVFLVYNNINNGLKKGSVAGDDRERSVEIRAVSEASAKPWL
jgi:hypothetical protein